LGGFVGGVVVLPVEGAGWPVVVGVIWLGVDAELCVFIWSWQALRISALDMLLSFAFCCAMQSFIAWVWEELVVEESSAQA
jgi:hypothetical protein